MANVSNEENKESPRLTSAINESKNEQEALEKEKIIMVVAFPLFGFLFAFAPAPVVFGAFFVFVIVLMLVL